MVIRISIEFKKQCKEDISSLKYGTLHIKEDNKDITESDDLKDFKITSSCYVNDKFIGTTVAKKITGNILNDGQHNLENKNIQVKTGTNVNGNIEYQSLDTYIIPKPNSDEVSQKTQFTGYDYMIKFDISYVDRVTYPIRMDDYLEELCKQVGVVLGNKTFLNNDYMILGNPFTNNESCKTVLSNICQLALGFAVFEEEKLYIKNLDINGAPLETIDGNNYMDFSSNNVFGPVNSFKIQMNSEVDGEESVREETGVTDENRCQISISDNYFLNSQEQRELVIDKMFNAIKGLTYLPVKVNYYGYPWLKLGDKIKVLDNNDKEYITYVMEHIFEYNGSYNGTVESKALTKTQSTYHSTQNIKKWKRQTELKVDKINGKITQLTQETTKHEEKIAKVEQDVDSIKQTVKDTAIYKREVEGITEIYLKEAGEAEILGLEIRGNKTYESILYPGENLYPEENLYPNQEVI